uniref:Uncharacterized protein n=1 Tax=Rhizophora mucronata TaxID=61149 RepID=A0A2P2NM27_RHIMU
MSLLKFGIPNAKISTSRDSLDISKAEKETKHSLQQHAHQP